MKVTIRQIAKQLGVHHTTVSRALRNSPRISENMRQRIKSLAIKLGYRPNLVASGLSTRKTFNVGLIVADISTTFFSQVARGVEDTMRRAGYNVFICNTDDKIEDEKFHWDALISRGVDGIIISPANLKPRYLQKLLGAGVPIVFIDRCLPSLRASYVITDHFSGGYQMTKYLLSLGHRRIAYVRGEVEMGRFYGYRQALKEYGIPVDNSLTPVCDFTIEGGKKAAKKLVRMEHPPTAIFCVNDPVALGAMKAIREHGFRIPEDISLAGFDNADFAEFLQPPLTTVHQSKYELGEEAAKILLQEMNGKLREPKKIEIKPVLVIRDSCRHIGDSRVNSALPECLLLATTIIA